MIVYSRAYAPPRCEFENEEIANAYEHKNTEAVRRPDVGIQAHSRKGKSQQSISMIDTSTKPAVDMLLIVPLLDRPFAMSPLRSTSHYLTCSHLLT